MKGKTLVISGGTRGIGQAIVYEFARAGVNIAFTYNWNEELAKEQVKDLETNYGIKARAYILNILEPETYKDLFIEIDKDFDRVDFFISNAIISGRSVVGGYTKFMKLKPRGINNIFTATVNAFVLRLITSSILEYPCLFNVASKTKYLGASVNPLVTAATNSCLLIGCSA